MLRFHHVNLGVPVGGADAEAAFLVDFLAYQRVELTADAPPTATWFESEDGKQIHLSEAALERKFEQAGYQYTGADGEDRPCFAKTQLEIVGNEIRVIGFGEVVHSHLSSRAGRPGCYP